MDPATLAKRAIEAVRKPFTLKEALMSVADSRIDRRKKFPLFEILMIAVCAMIDGAKGPTDFERFGRAKFKFLGKFLPLQNGIPGHDTFRRVLGKMDPKRFNAVLVEWLKSVADVAGDVISIDGKLLRRALTKDGKMPCIVSAHSDSTKLVIGQVKADEKSNEITAIPDLLDVLYLKGAIVTIDAAGCQRKIVRKILKRGAGYIIPLKGNLQASLRSEVSQQPASSNSASSGKRTGALSPLVAGYWMLVVGTLRPQAASKSAWSSPSCATRAQGRRLARHGSSSRRCLSTRSERLRRSAHTGAWRQCTGYSTWTSTRTGRGRGGKTSRRTSRCSDTSC